MVYLCTEIALVKNDLMLHMLHNEKYQKYNVEQKDQNA